MASVTIGDYKYSNLYETEARAVVIDKTKTTYGEILSSVTINGRVYPVSSLEGCFQECTALTTAPTIPNSVKYLSGCFWGCAALTTAPTIPNSVIDMSSCFRECTALTTAPTIPNSVSSIWRCFDGSTALTGAININANVNNYTSAFAGTQKGIWLTGTSTKLAEIAATATNNNVFVGEIPLSYSLDIERVAGDGGTVQDPEGLCAHVQLTINWTDLTDNSIDAITLINGTASTSPTWYTDAAKTSTIALPNWRPSASTTIHCWLAITSATHVFSVTVADHYHTGVVISFTVPQQFRTMDFLAGGQGVAFGMPATQAGMFINMALALKQANGIIANIYDVFYPVGSYYETSDSNFDPNAVWGGTWVLETEGQVHVSAGANYPVAGALSNATDGGESEHTLTTNEMAAHTHGHKTLTGYFTIRKTYNGSNNVVSRSGIVTMDTSGSGGQTATNATVTSLQQINIDASHEHSSVGGGNAHNNMQPYINIYRWHRTA